MAEEMVNITDNQEENVKVKKAKVGDIIQIKRGKKKGKKGKVLTIRDNSVIVQLGMNEKKNEPIKTVVNHKNYKIVKG
jgi:uncharacterized protein YkvS